MNQEDILRMAREAGLEGIYSACDEPGVRYAYEDWDDELECFAHLVAAAERKSVADLVEQMGIEGYGTLAISAAIRATGD